MSCHASNSWSAVGEFAVGRNWQQRAQEVEVDEVEAEATSSPVNQARPQARDDSWYYHPQQETKPTKPNPRDDRAATGDDTRPAAQRAPGEPGVVRHVQRPAHRGTAAVLHAALRPDLAVAVSRRLFVADGAPDLYRHQPADLRGTLNRAGNHTWCVWFDSRQASCKINCKLVRRRNLVVAEAVRAIFCGSRLPHWTVPPCSASAFGNCSSCWASLLLIFGTRLPSIARSMGKSITEFKRGMHEDDPAADRLEQK